MADTDRDQMLAEAHRVPPSVLGTDGPTVPVRANRYGELHTLSLTGSKLVQLCEEGNYYSLVNAMGTGVAGHAAPGANGTATKALVFLRNNYTTAEDKRIYLDYISLVPTTAGTNSTDFGYSMVLDSGATRYSSGGTAFTPSNTNMQSSNTATCTFVFGAATVAAATTAARTVAHKRLRPVIPVIGDTYLFRFGDAAKQLGGLATAGTATVNMIIDVAPVVLGPSDQFLLHEAATGQDTARSYEFNIGFYVR